MATDQRRVEYLMDFVHTNPGEDYPGEKPFDTKFSDPEVLSEHGYDAMLADDRLGLAMTFDDHPDAAGALGTEARELINDVRSDIQAAVTEAQKFDIDPFCSLDLIAFPKVIIDRFGDEVLDETGERIEFRRDRTKTLLRTGLKEVFERFPELAGIVVRVGENYAAKRSPHHVGDTAIPFAEINDVEARDRYEEILRFLRQEICERHDRMLVFRTWDLFTDGFHSCPEYYSDVTDRISPHENLFFSMKVTQTDFWRYVGFNECIGTGQHEQLVEVQCQREYEGKGAFPNYIVQGMIDGFPEYSERKGLADVLGSPQVAGVYTWSRGGGWDGPYIRNESWIDLNVSVLARWLNDATISEPEAFSEYIRAKYGLSSDDAAAFRRIARLSESAVLKGRYCEPYDIDREPWCMTENWLRDDVLGGENQLEVVISDLFESGDVAVALTEKREAIALWMEMRALFDQIDLQPGSAATRRQWKALEASLEYGLSFFTYVYAAWLVTAVGYAVEQGTFEQIPEREDEMPLRSALQFHDTAWERHLTVTDEYTAAATPFSQQYHWDHPGIDSLVEAYRSLASE